MPEKTNIQQEQEQDARRYIEAAIMEAEGLYNVYTDSILEFVDKPADKTDELPTVSFENDPIAYIKSKTEPTNLKEVNRVGVVRSDEARRYKMMTVDDDELPPIGYRFYNKKYSEFLITGWLEPNTGGRGRDTVNFVVCQSVASIGKERRAEVSYHPDTIKLFCTDEWKGHVKTVVVTRS